MAVQRYEFRGSQLTISEICALPDVQKLGLSPSLIRMRINRSGWTIERAATEPLVSKAEAARAGGEAKRRSRKASNVDALDEIIAKRTERAGGNPPAKKSNGHAAPAPAPAPATVPIVKTSDGPVSARVAIRGLSITIEGDDPKLVADAFRTLLLGGQ